MKNIIAQNAKLEPEGSNFSNYKYPFFYLNLPRTKVYGVDMIGYGLSPLFPTYSNIACARTVIAEHFISSRK